jgi:hypothetical protein
MTSGIEKMRLHLQTAIDCSRMLKINMMVLYEAFPTANHSAVAAAAFEEALEAVQDRRMSLTAQGRSPLLERTGPADEDSVEAANRCNVNTTSSLMRHSNLPGKQTEEGGVDALHYPDTLYGTK